jgi:bifunctional non-homologous end joining protein LigD
MPLDHYRRKRNFEQTPEPSGAPATSHGSQGNASGATGPLGGRFVVQRHRATRLHWDFRLEMGGVLASWAVPKGPSLDPAIRRMAVHVEDHPVEYFDFEGVIPARQYGAGDVIVWDWGTYEPESETPEPVKAIADGELKFRIYGEKLKGRFTLVRTTGRGSGAASGESDGDQWLLIHKRDEYASAGWDAEDHPLSVKTGRTNDDVKAQRDAVWVSEAPAAQAEIDLSGARIVPMPSFIPPMKATLTDHPFTDPDWLFEVKWDGYRIEAVVDRGTVKLWTRNEKDGETYFAGFLRPASWIDAEQAIVDGEVVALDDDGRPDFGLLQERISGSRRGSAVAPGHREPTLVYQAFDLLYLDGRLLVDVPLEERKRLLRSVLKPQSRVRYAAHVETDGEAFFRAAEERKLEGIIAKHRRSRYEPDHRSRTWLKVKVRPEQELVVGGYLPGEGTHTELGALVIGTYEGGRLRYGGRVGSGIDAKMRRQLRERLDALTRGTSPFDPAPPPLGDLRDVHWAEPQIVIRAEFSNWTRDDLVRQAAFKGLDLGKDPKKVVRERPTPAGEAEADADRSVEGDSDVQTAPKEKRAAPAADGGPRMTRSHAAATEANADQQPTVKRSRRTATKLSGDEAPATPHTRANATEADADPEPAVNRTRWTAADEAPPTPRGRRKPPPDLPTLKTTRRRAAHVEREDTATPKPARQAPASVADADRDPAATAGPGRGKRGNPTATRAAERDRSTHATPAEVAALDGLGAEGTWSVGGHELKLTNLDKVIFDGRDDDPRPVTKRDLVRYFALIAPVMLPHLADRPLNLHRYPNGAAKPGFWQKSMPPGQTPPWLTIWHETGIGDERKPNDHVVADAVATLCWLGNLAAFEIHAWTSTIADPWRPTFALIDIDPGPKTTWDQVITLAKLYRTALDHLKVRAYPKVTGRRGIQAWIPVEPRYDYQETSAWVEGVSRAVGQIVPDLVSWEWSVANRRGLARLDYTQNASIKTLVAPYAVRPAPGAPVSAPIAWDELDDPDLRPDRWTVRTLIERVAKVGDLFAGALTDRQTLPKL